MNYTVVRGWLAPTPEPQPTTIDELVERAIAEHLKFHADDGLGLFIWATPDVTGAALHLPHQCCRFGSGTGDRQSLPRTAGHTP